MKTKYIISNIYNVCSLFIGLIGLSFINAFGKEK